ncbi:hypothetical protein [Mumia sp. zg.B53]|nr:hypothetical protein [Mumia sp. zg.B53]
MVEPLLAPLAPEVFVRQRELGLSVERIAAGLGVLAHGVLGHP